MTNEKWAVNEVLVEFGGSVGNFSLMIFFLAIIVYFFFCWCFNGGAFLSGLGADWLGWLVVLVFIWEVVFFYVGWFLF